MNLREHVVLGAAVGAALVPVVGLEAAAAFWASSVLLDVDHYWEYLEKNGFRDWSPRHMFAYHGEVFRRLHRPDMLALSLFHTVEWLALVFVAWQWQGGVVLGAALAGMLFHLGLDLARLAWLRAVTARALSLVEYGIRRRALARRGLDPDAVPREALIAIGVTPAAWIVPARTKDASAFPSALS
jgi:hypothetical protein